MKQPVYIIDLQNISKKYILRNWKSILLRQTNTVQAIHNISFQVKEGEIMGIIGPNGAGKTTLLKILATLITPDQGTLSIAGIHNTTKTLAIKKNIGFVNTNDRSFYWRLTGIENLEFFGHLYNLTGKRLKDRIQQVIELTDLAARSRNPFATFSSGERQRLAIARAMLSEPTILLMDEATTNLDPIVSANLLDFTKETLSKQLNKTIIWCTHNLKEAEKICDRVTILNKGSVVSCMTINKIKTSIGNYNRYRLVLNSIPSSLKSIKGFQEEPHDDHKCCTLLLEEKMAPKIIHSLSNNNIRLYEFTKLQQELENIFIDLLADKTEGVHNP